MRKSNPFRKPENAWKKTEFGVELIYPIFHHDPTIPDDPIIKLTMEDVINDYDFCGWEGNQSDRIVDSSGKVFIAEFKKVKGYTFFIIPTEMWSGVFPGEVERTMRVEEVKEIMISGIEKNKIRIKENIEELKTLITAMNSIKEILTKCENYF